MRLCCVNCDVRTNDTETQIFSVERHLSVTDLLHVNINVSLRITSLSSKSVCSKEKMVFNEQISIVSYTLNSPPPYSITSI